MRKAKERRYSPYYTGISSRQFLIDRSRGISRSSLRSSSIPRYQDHQYFTRLNTEKKDQINRYSEDGSNRDRLLKRSGNSSLNLAGFQNESWEEAYCRKGASPHTKDQLSWSIVSSSRIHEFSHPELRNANQQSKDQTLRLPPFFYANSSPKKTKLSRGLCNKSRRKNLPSRIKRTDLSIIPEQRDESEEPMSTSISTRHFIGTSQSPLLKCLATEC